MQWKKDGRYQRGAHCSVARLLLQAQLLDVELQRRKRAWRSAVSHQLSLPNRATVLFTVHTLAVNTSPSQQACVLLTLYSIVQPIYLSTQINLLTSCLIPKTKSWLF